MWGGRQVGWQSVDCGLIRNQSMTHQQRMKRRLEATLRADGTTPTAASKPRSAAHRRAHAQQRVRHPDRLVEAYPRVLLVLAGLAGVLYAHDLGGLRLGLVGFGFGFGLDLGRVSFGPDEMGAGR